MYFLWIQNLVATEPQCNSLFQKVAEHFPGQSNVGRTRTDKKPQSKDKFMVLFPWNHIIYIITSVFKDMTVHSPGQKYFMKQHFVFFPTRFNPWSVRNLTRLFSQSSFPLQSRHANVCVILQNVYFRDLSSLTEEVSNWVWLQWQLLISCEETSGKGGKRNTRRGGSKKRARGGVGGRWNDSQWSLSGNWAPLILSFAGTT